MHSRKLAIEINEVIEMFPIVISAIESVEDRDLMTQFYTSYKALMFSEARKHLDIEEDIEDVVYEALTRIIDKMNVFRELAPKQRLRYALTCVRNICFVSLKRKSIIPTVSFDDVDTALFEDVSQRLETVVEKKLIVDYIRCIWCSLESDTRMLMEQKYILRWSDEELAEILGIQPQSVRMRLTRAKRQLMAQLQKNGFHLDDWLPD
jgi:RNA polymerase sigma-70 factor (ECF subfamily)